MGPATISFGSHDTFKWKNGNSDNDNVVEVKPLLGALQHQNLSTNEQFNIAGMFGVLMVLAATGMLMHGAVSWLRRHLLFWSERHDRSTDA